ncbi:MAG TPA: TIGR02466 family protein [Steroidobacteraceae bacterium]|nr:TIGR02466 family protein [Steroidobacteraceae bacterium]
MSVQALFPTLVYTQRLRGASWRALNARLLRECRQLRAEDGAGRRWSARNYPGGYTSYGSASRMHRQSPTFAALARELDRRVLRFAAALEFDLDGRALAMTDCWVNIMGRGAAHGLHLHPLSTISGSYYVAVPAGSPGLKLEDPRLERYMAAPPRRTRAARARRPWVVITARSGQLVLFESWLRHEVPPQAGAGERVSISFNYGWF